MSETLSVPKDKVLEAYSIAKQPRKTMLEDLFGIKTFIPEIKDRIKNFDDVLKENSITREDFEKSCKGLEPDEIAYRMAKLVCIAFNEGWTPDWTNSNEYKYAPYFRMGSSSGVGFSFVGYGYWHSRSLVGSRLCFKSSDLASHAEKLFEQEIYKPLFTI